MVTGLYGGILALGLILLIVLVVKRRFKHKVSLGDGGVDDLSRYTRSHGNFIETVPMALILMLVLEMRGAPFWLVHCMGILLVTGRISHFFGLTRGTSYGIWRRVGMALTILVYVIGSIVAIYQYLDWTLGF